MARYLRGLFPKGQPCVNTKALLALYGNVPLAKGRVDKYKNTTET